MRNLLPASAVALVGTMLLLGGCGRENASEAPAAAPDTSAQGGPTEQPGTDSPSDVSPTTAQTWLDDFSIGSEIAPDGTIPAGKGGDDFAPGQAVYLSMEVNDAPPTTPVKVIWYGPNDTKIGEESKQVTQGEKYLSFTASDTKSWAKGDYRAEIWVGDEKVNQQQFNITDASKATS